MKPYLKTALLFLILCYSKSLFAQSISVCCDTVICTPGSPVTLNATVVATNVANLVNPIDDQFSPVVPIGFTFNYFGTNYTQCILSTNDYISFDTTNASSYSPWSIGNANPSTLNPLNSIMGPWQDLNPSSFCNTTGGTMTYGTFGTSPNQYFVYEFCQMAMFSCCDSIFSGQIVLYEGTNEIEIHIKKKELCTGWNGGAAIEGIQDATGAIAFTVPGRNYPSQWGALNDGYKFTPTSATNYNGSVIPFAPKSIPGGITWTTLGGTFIGNGTSITVNPFVTTSYIVSNSASSCSAGGAGATADTVTITVSNLNLVSNITNYDCLAGTSGLDLGVGTSQTWPVNLTWYDGGHVPYYTVQLTSSSNINTLSGLMPGEYYYHIADTIGCVMNDSFAIVASNFPTFTYQSVATNCPTGNDGMAIALPSNNTPNYNYVWDDASHTNLQSNFSHQNDSLKNRTVGKYYITISTSPICFTKDSVTITSNPFSAAFTTSPLNKCALVPIDFNGTHVGKVQQYIWGYGDGQTGMNDTSQHTYTVAGNYSAYFIISGQGGCIDTANLPVLILPNIKNNFVSSDFELCKGEVFGFTDLSTCTPVKWRWSFGDGVNDTTHHTANHGYNAYGDFLVHLYVQDSLCGADSSSLMVHVITPPHLTLGDDISTCDGTVVTIIPTTNGTVYNWSTGETASQITYRVNEESQIILTVANATGCKTSDTLLLHPHQCLVFLPNTFTPNGDGLNDYFRIIGERIARYDIQVFDRWGNRVYAYAGSDMSTGWNGNYLNQPSPEGVYMYYVKAILINDEVVSLKGDITLVR